MRRLFACLFLIPLAACGGNETTEAPTPTTSAVITTTTTTPEDALKAEANSYLANYLQGNGAAVYGQWSKRCQATQTQAEVEKVTSAASAGFMNAKLLDMKTTVTGDTGRVVGTMDTPALNDPKGKAWLRESGVWKWDGC
jgi:invasion protein IalB